MSAKKIFRPCDECACNGICMGCRQWRCWFRAYWAALKKRKEG